MNVKKIYILCIVLFVVNNVLAQPTPYLQRDSNTTPNYYEIINYWKALDKKSNLITMQEIGNTDANLPLHVVYIQQPKLATNAVTILINNGIHPGEPDGIDACLHLAHHIVNGSYQLPSNVRLAIIPVYNIGGCLNRSANYRVDQNGPDEFGFRGNSQNLDLNRDFIKNDSKEAQTFSKLFAKLRPQIFIDNHVSNGADYQHTMTLLTTEYNKLGGPMGKYLHEKMEPEIYRLMKTKNWDLVPYVNFFGETPEEGWTAFYDSPRYSTGYTSLWHCFGFVPETHMLKPYPQRVKATYDLMQQFIQFATANNVEILKKQKEQIAYYQNLKQVPIDWSLNDKVKDAKVFKGYESGKKTSSISGTQRLYYDKQKPFTKNVPFSNSYITKQQVTAPSAYVIPQANWKVIDLLKNNAVVFVAIKNDTIIEVETYKITNYKSSATPYEMHHANSNVEIEKASQKISFRKGDLIITTNQLAKRFLIETLEPQAKDSYFTWNFFDGILNRKEGFSDYVFEETAEQILIENPEIKKELDNAKAKDEKLAKNGYAQLEFIYKKSKYFETNYMQYPVYRIIK